ncbi:MAG: S41 family peptidase [Acidimicrobiia bacterium]
MTKKSLTTTLILFALVVAACQAATTTSTTQDHSATTQAPATTVIEGRVVETVDCSSAPDDVVIVCEVVDTIDQHYVDDIDVATLAAAAAEGVEALDGASAEGPLICPLPSEEFLQACNLSAGEAEDSIELAEAMVTGMAAFALDPNSTYLDPQALALLREEQGGSIQGIGALVSPEDRTLVEGNRQCSVISETCRIYVVATIEGAPAEAAGLLRDDVIVAVDGESILGWSVDEVTATVRGPAGTDVTLTIERSGETFDVTITRAAVTIPVLDSAMIGDVGYIRLSIFNEAADEQFKKALLELVGKGAETLVIDLRNNPGGLLETAINITSFFLPDGEVVTTEGPDGDRVYRVTGNDVVPEEIPVIVVVNKGSASASEVVTGALQERGRVTVVGENTFGKNTVQQRYSLSNGGAFKLTVARWLTPGGHDFGGTGLTPDVPLEIDPGIDAETLVDQVLAAVGG